IPHRPGQRRTPRFSHEAVPREFQASLPLGADEADVRLDDEHAQGEAALAREAPSVVPIYLLARDEQGFSGAELIAAFARHGFEFGEMDVYHHADSAGHVLFSLMNGVAPGTFDPTALPEQRTPALALFLRLPIAAAQPVLVFEQFLDIAHRLADELNGMLLDDRREEISSESIDRMREIALD
ncbi:MAG: cell division protein ZipA C-terminal FtsZ-binding domain-containing protein, partial [Pseudomonadota bacterium]